MTEQTHRAAVSPAEGVYVAKVDGISIARSSDAKILQEVNGAKTYRPVIYFPLADVDPAALKSGTHRTHCPIKGDAGYYDISAGGALLKTAAWFYPTPLPMVAAIKDHVAFYPDKVSVDQA